MTQFHMSENVGNLMISTVLFNESPPFQLCGAVQGSEKVHILFTVSVTILVNILILTRITWVRTSGLLHNSVKLMLPTWWKKSRGKVFDGGKTEKWATCQLNNKSLNSLALKSHFVYSYLHESKGFQFLNSIHQIVGCPT